MPSYAQEKADTVLTDSLKVLKDTTKIVSDSSLLAKKEEPKEKHFQYFRIGIDASKLIRSALTDDYNTVEFLFEGVWKPKMHYVAEGGFATSSNRGENIQFEANSYFLRLGFDKYFFGKLYKGDLDNAFFGLRLASALNNRQEATAQLWDPYYGNTTITKEASTNMFHWLELTAGFRIELTKSIFVGWNMRGKTFFNPAKIRELTPTYLAGYGAAKKQPVIGYNFYLLYGFGKR